METSIGVIFTPEQIDRLIEFLDNYHYHYAKDAQEMIINEQLSSEFIDQIQDWLDDIAEYRDMFYDIRRGYQNAIGEEDE